MCIYTYRNAEFVGEVNGIGRSMVVTTGISNAVGRRWLIMVIEIKIDGGFRGGKDVFFV